MALTLSAVPAASSIAQYSLLFGVGAVCAQSVAVGAHSQLASNPFGVNAINAAFGMGSILAPLSHSFLHSSLACGPSSYLPFTGLLAVSAVPWLRQLTSKDAARPRDAARGGDATEAAAPAAPPRLLTGAMLVLVACCVGGEVSIASWLFSHAVESGLGAEGASRALASFWVALTSGRLLATALSSTLSPSKLLWCSLPLGIVGAGIGLAAHGETALAVGAALCGAGVSAGFANSVALLARAGTYTTRTQSAVQLAACAGGLLFAPLCGILAAHTPLGSAAFLAVAGGCASVTVGCLGVASFTKRRSAVRQSVGS